MNAWPRKAEVVADALAVVDCAGRCRLLGVQEEIRLTAGDLVANQPLAFAALLGGGLLIVSALTNTPLTDTAQGKVNKVTDPSGTVTMGSSAVTAINAQAHPNAAGLVNPFARAKGITPERVDMGKDYALVPGDPIDALGDSRVIGQLDNWYNGQPFVWFQLLNENGGTSPTAARPNAGKYWYVAEQINPLVHPGQVVAAGQQVATYAQSGTGIEVGFAVKSGETLAQATTGYAEGEVTQAGSEFQHLLESVGAPV